MENIEISDHDFDRLKAYAVPFEDTPASVVSRLLDIADANHARNETNRGKEGFPEVEQNKRYKTHAYSIRNTPPLVHTKILEAKIAGKYPEKNNWDSLVRLSIISILNRNMDIFEAKRISGANLVAGQKIEQGYKYIPKYDFSYQGVSADDAARIIGRCVMELNCTLYIEFEWRSRADAFKPTERGLLTYEPERGEFFPA